MTRDFGFFGFGRRAAAWVAALAAVLALSGCADVGLPTGAGSSAAVPAASVVGVVEDATVFNGVEIPAWDGATARVDLNGGEPWFDDADRSRTDAFETYSELDALGRCGVAYANVCRELMPADERGEIGSVRPSGWHTVRYNDLIAGNYLYNRCHLIGFQLAGENANERNLITGTRHLNIEGMLDLENLVDGYVDETGNHVLYRVTPVYDGDDLVARGVVMEGYSVEDAGAGVEFCVFAYNVQPGVGIDYATGESWRLDGLTREEAEDGVKVDFVLNTRSGKFHRPDCRHAASVAPEYRVEAHETLRTMLDAGYDPCGVCHPDA